MSAYYREKGLAHGLKPGVDWSLYFRPGSFMIEVKKL